MRGIANVRRNFDVALLEVRSAEFMIDALGGRPVLPNPGLFLCRDPAGRSHREAGGHRAHYLRSAVTTRF
jgi:hypothetical protein